MVMVDAVSKALGVFILSVVFFLIHSVGLCHTPRLLLRVSGLGSLDLAQNLAQEGGTWPCYLGIFLLFPLLTS